MLQTIIETLTWLPFLMGCLAIYKPKGVSIAKKYLSNGYENNSEGAGFVVCKDGKLEISKGFFKFEEFWSAFKDLQRFPAMVHFRIATHGKVEEQNCHPFSILDGEFAMVHNGVLPLHLEPPSGRKESDSDYFAQNTLAPILEHLPFRHSGMSKLIEEAIGKFNKIVVMRRDSITWILNQDSGNWHKGAWFSNKSYEAVVRYHPPTNSTYWTRLYTPTAAQDRDLATLEGDYEYAPETEQEREVQDWLAEQERKSKTPIKAVPLVPLETYTEREARLGRSRQYLLEN